MRDLYNRAEKLAYWLKRIETDLQGSDKEDVLCSDKEDVLCLVQFMQDHERSSLWIIRCITILILVRKQLHKPFRVASLDDIRVLLHWLDNKGYKSSSIEKFRKVLKFFFKVVYGQNRYYPEQVQWIYTKVSKERDQKKRMDMDEYLEEEKIQKLVDTVQSVQKKAFIACTYECGRDQKSSCDLQIPI
jgi:integrase/recombinase XerD